MKKKTWYLPKLYLTNLITCMLHGPNELLVFSKVKIIFYFRNAFDNKLLFYYFSLAPAAPPSQLRFKHDLVQSERKLAVQWHKIDCSRQTVGRLLHYQIRYCLVEGGRKCNGQGRDY